MQNQYTMSKLLFLGIIATQLITACGSTSVTGPEPLRIIEAEGLEIPVYDEEGLEYFLEKQDDKVHVVNFWATWCAPCVKELPEFERLNSELKGEGVEVVLVSLDFEKDLDEKLPRFVKQKLKSDVIVVLPDSEQKMIDMVSSQWDGALPGTLIYDNNKRFFIAGSTDYEELMTELRKFKDL